MKFITCNQRFGRTSHRLKDIFSVFIFSFFNNDLKVVRHPSWTERRTVRVGRSGAEINSTSIFDFAKIPMFNYVIPTHKIKYTEAYWDGIDFDLFKSINDEIKSLKPGTTVEFKSVIRIHPVQLTTWYSSGLIGEDIFLNRVIPTLRNLYYKQYVSIDDLQDQLAIHIRRGDAAHMSHTNWSLDYYVEFIKSFNESHPHTNIKVFSEYSNSEDIQCLAKLPNTEIILGDDTTLYNDLQNMIFSKFFLPCNSGLSTWVSYITLGKVFIRKDKVIKHFHKEHIW